MKYETIDELMDRAYQAEGKTFGEIDTTGRIKNIKSKGTLGNIIEESFFSYAVNSIAEPDFDNLGVELKVTPVKKNKNGTLSSKERLVLNIIDYMKEFELTFESSSFYTKANKMLIMLYQYEKEQSLGDYRILKVFLNEFSEEDLAVIQRDWEIIISKIKNGEAHLISEADTMYLSACTKGANKESVRKQPFSPLRAKQRAFSLKASYMTGIIRKHLTPEHLESLSAHNELKEKTLEQILEERFKPHYGKKIDQLCTEVGIRYNPRNKSMIPHIMTKLLGVKKNNLSDIEEFAKANITFKTISLEPNGSLREHMSFKNINFKTFLNEEWEESELYELFAEQKFLFLVFRYTEDHEPKVKRIPYFEGIKLWNMPQQSIEEELYSLWSEIGDVLKAGVELTTKGSKTYNNLPGPKFNNLCHVRPKAKDSKDKVVLPDGQYITKQCYWLDKQYVLSILDK
ncbi:Type-2 restriction enzyme Sau3AI [Bacillus sp. THAF10]|uniref:Sau3AI family type II restriction endonuclease n=1 Tax=Bacillus sp. THAF10 TaxID=2587848 RepID=UPI0012678607|nr:Sau3AI family type II restriction endonuclease [Bacillus sp. THAF10]QFT87681.1 Type-2 restriction enzyme Sau3AI [Bacillus sp. THAF10]